MGGETLGSVCNILGNIPIFFPGAEKTPTKISTQPVSEPGLDPLTHGLQRNNSNHDSELFRAHVRKWSL